MVPVKMVPPRFLNHFFGVFLSSREMFLISVHKGTPPAAHWPPVFPGELSSHLVSFNSSFFPPFSRTGDIQKCCNLRLFSLFCSLIFNVFVLTDSQFPAWRDFFKKRKRIYRGVLIVFSLFPVKEKRAEATVRQFWGSYSEKRVLFGSGRT